jgi:hypothetical protein
MGWAFDAFIASLDRIDRQSADQLDVTAIRAMDPDERARATEVLLARMSGDDTRVPFGLILVASRDTAVASLTAAMARGGSMAVAAAVAHGELTGGGGKETLLRALENGNDVVLAAIGLKQYRGPDVDAIVLPVLERSDGELARHLAEVLWNGHQLDRFCTTSPMWGMRLLQLRLGSAYASIRHPAVAELRRVLAALADGREPSTLGYSMADPTPGATYQRLMDSIGTGVPGSYDRDAFALLEGEERLRAELILIHERVLQPT